VSSETIEGLVIVCETTLVERIATD
jgi:hypothetical protein